MGWRTSRRSGAALAAPTGGIGMKTVALVACHFVPSNLASVHRARLFAQHLPEFGWRPLIVTTAPEHYEEPPDPALEALVDADLEIVRTSALRNRGRRWIGDLGVRAFPYHLAALKRLTRERRIDFCHVTIPSNFSAPLGRLLQRATGVPYGIDYIDPWVHVWPGVERRFSRHWWSHQLSLQLEPWAVRDARLISGVASGYYDGVLERNPQLRAQAVTAAMPYGASERDFAVARSSPAVGLKFAPNDGGLHIVYAGALMPKSVESCAQLLRALAALKARAHPLALNARLHFIGTGHRAAHGVTPQIQPLLAGLGLGDQVTEYPERMPYLQVLKHLLNAAGVLILGSTEAHYTPSKAYQAAQSERPVLAFLHPAAAAGEFLAQALGERLVRVSTPSAPTLERVEAALAAFLERLALPSLAPDPAVFAPVSARAVAATLAGALDRAVAR
jgi:hypothetical protein